MHVMLRLVRSAALVIGLSSSFISNASAQELQLVFTPAIPELAARAAAPAAAVVEERGLALWAGFASDFGVGVTVSGSGWTVRSIASMTVLPIDGHQRPTFQQVDVVRRVFSSRLLSIAGGGGVRQEWDGTSILVGRVLAGVDVGRARLQGSVVIERALSSAVAHDAADLITTLGWSRRVGSRVSVGVEGIGQDIEGFWNPAEADGGARLLVGPSLHAQSTGGRWAASLTAGPVVHTLSTATSGVFAGRSPSGGRHFGIFASGTWMPSRHR
jgi:hypothetical protein